ncbi:serine hydrolase [Ottowia testudinis]|uniref:Serine hydrolase n=1 Tax=Ottowia testudinis TaxID=2816950 RepID=A0A975CHS0_9BURK|nr:serine hydrolase [Ottowia testudinis]QTD46056.1 serine hydrolase [Ottowia testudinis]
MTINPTRSATLPNRGRRSLLGLGLALPACGGGDDDSGRRERVQRAARALPRYARALLAETGVSGLALAVVQGGQTILAEGFGHRRAGSGEAVDADTVFQLASVSKSIGATVVARQIGDGRVAWDTRMQTLLPWFALENADSTARLTLGDLYAHRSGLPDHAGDKLEEVGFAARQVLERLRLLPVQALGRRYAYTNFGITAGAMGVAAAAEQDWAELSERSLYAPLGMARTSSRHADYAGRANRAAGHVRDAAGRWVPALARNADAQSPAGGVSSCVTDLARWLALLLAGGRWQGRQLVAAEPLRAAMSPQAPGGAYGYGFNIGQTPAGHRLISHSGAFMLGAGTCFMLVPALDAGVVVLTNAVPLGLAEAVCRHFIELAESGRAGTDWWAAYRTALAPLMAPTGRLLREPVPTRAAPPLPLARYAGRYANPYYGRLDVRVLAEGAGQALQLALGPAPQTYRLQPWQGDDFSFVPANESAAPGSLSLARFDLAGASVWLEFYDDEGWGRFTR